MADRDKDLPAKSSRTEVDAFLRRVADAPARSRQGGRGRLVFALDATASRQPTWDHACQIQAEMFEEAGRLGGLEIQLLYYRGFRELHAGPWLRDGAALARQMSGVRCLAGETQIGPVLEHTLAETRRARVDALVFVGDCMEEQADGLCALAGQLGLHGVPIFVFHEGGEPSAAQTFRQLARLSHGAYCPFDSGSARQLRDLLSAVAIFAAGGRQALEDYGKQRGGLAHELTRLLAGPQD